MSSLFTWLDYSEADRRRMMEIVALLDEKDTRDELGLASVRDAFADLFFPGTSTIQTRARYFLFVPWIYLRLEKSRTPHKEIAGKARAAELALMANIESSEDHDGNIGRRAKERLKRLPSNVYWRGLESWGIRTFYGSQDQYHNSIDFFYSKTIRRNHRPVEDEHEEGPTSNWNLGLLPPPQDFPVGCSFVLTRGEAEYLADCIRSACPRKLITSVINLKSRTDNVRFVWEHPGRASFSNTQMKELSHAQNFSELMLGVVLIYNLMLQKQTGRDTEDIQERIKAWTEMIEDRIENFRAWDRSEFWNIVEAVGNRIALTTKGFVNEWWDLCLKHRLSKLAEMSSVQDLIRNREKLLKRALARLDNPRAGELWSGASGLGQLDFRWSVTQRIINDIVQGLEQGESNAQP